MRVLLLVFAFVALAVKSEPQWDRNNFNRTQLVPQFNKTQWNAPSFNRTQWYGPKFNRTQWNYQVLNRTQNQTQWKLDALDNFQINSRNRTNTRLQALNNTLWNGPGRNGTRWSSRAKREDLRYVVPAVVPVLNSTWNQTTHNGDVIVGQVGYLDRLLFNQTYRKERRWWSSREKIIEYPHDLPGRPISRQETITALRIYNKFYDGLEAKAEILSGGVGYRYAKIRLSSPWNRGFEYLVQIFGR